MNALPARAQAAVLLTAALLMPRTARSEFARRDAGTSAAQFLEFGADARAAAMGNAGRALCEDAAAVYWNPAGLAALRHRHATATHGALYQSVFYDFLAYAQPVDSILGRARRGARDNPLGAVGVAVLYLNVGAIGTVDNTGQATGESFTPQDAAAMVSWGGTLTRNLDAGVGLKLVTESIRERATGGAADFGLRLRGRLGYLPYAASLSAHNVGGGLKFHRQSDPLPLQVVLGQSLRLRPGWSVAADVTGARDRGIYPSFGTELRVPIDPGFSAAGRLGWEGRTMSDLEGLSGLALGAGLGLWRLGFDYAWTPFGVLGIAHRLSFSYRF
ncbi:MAG: PorV/PorQ family protein [Elusimicrobia bacterium]|nr:PorV/PorQ family protein [Elusimicrobiota bacterium]